MNSLQYSELKQTKLFVDFVAGADSISKYFQHNEGTFPPPETNAVIAALRESMSCCELTRQQEDALQRFGQGAKRIVTGQQTGLFGGALYTLYKASTALHLAEQYPEPAVAVFWVEDNDHDAAESAKISHPSKELGLIDCILPIDTTSKIPVSELHITDEQIKSIDNFMALVDTIPFRGEIEDIIKNYTVGTEWTVGFIKTLQLIFGDRGLLFLRASVARRAGLFAPIVQHELKHPSLLENVVNTTSQQLQEGGYHSQAKPSKLNLFLHTDGVRHKVNNIPGDDGHYYVGSILYSLDELLKKSETNPSLYSPSVLLRPLIQDYVVGTDVYVAGPGEVAYLAQIQPYYAHIGLTSPQIVNRHSATLIPRRISRFLEKQSLSISSLMKPYNDVEYEQTLALRQSPVFDAINQTQSVVETSYTALKVLVKAVDATLESTVIGAEKNLSKDIETITKKVTAALKRKEEQFFQKLREVYAVSYPNGTLQERSLSPIFLIGEIGLVATKQFLRELTEMPTDVHLVMPIQQEPMQS